MTGNDYTLYELNRMVRSVLESSLDEEYWVVGELSDATQGYGGPSMANSSRRRRTARGYLPAPE